MTLPPHQQQTDYLRLTTPDGWEVFELDGSNALVIVEPRPGEPFQPNFVVAEYPWEGSIAELSASHLQRSAELAPGIPVQTLDVAEIEWNGHPARYQRAAYPLNGTTITIDRVLAAAGGRGLEATLSTPLRDSLLAPHLLAALLEFVTWDVTTEPGSAADGSDKEELGQIPPVFQSGGWAVRHLAAEALREVDVTRPLPAVNSIVREELTRSGAMDGSGRIDDQLLELLAILRFHDVRLTGTMRHGERTSHLEICASPHGVAVDSGPSLRHMAASPGAVIAEAHHFRQVNHGEVPLVLAEWLGLGPAWGLPESVVALAPDVIAKRLLLGPDAPPPASLDAPGSAAWAEPWTVWEIQFDGEPGMSIAAIRAGRFGYLRSDGRSGGERRSSQPGDIWTTLAALWTIQLDNTLGLMESA